MNLARIIQTQAQARPNKCAIEFAAEEIRYAELWAGIVSIGARLRAAGIGRGARVGLCLRDHPMHVALHFAIAGLGAVVVPLDHRWSAAERDAAIAAFGVGLLVVDEDAPDSAEGVARLGVGPLLLADDASDVDFPATENDDWLISLSSGTTGRPKGALVTHRQMYERFVTQWVTLGFNCNDRFALVTPLVFGAGRSFSMSCLAAGSTLVLLPPPMKPAALAAAIGAASSTATFLVPTLMRRLLELPGDAPMFPTLRRLLISGEAFFPAEVSEFQRRLSPNLIGYYASSEGGGVSVLQPADFATHGNSVGQAAFGVEVDVVGADGSVVAEGEVGRLRYRGPGVTTRALDADGVVQAATDGWCYPGDLACIDSEGYLSLCGREKDMIVRAGVNVYPAEVEQTLKRCPEVREVAVVGRPSTRYGEVPVAFVVLRSTDDAEAGATERLRTFCEAEMAPYKIPAGFELCAELPKSNAGKTDKNALRRRLASDPVLAEN